MLVASLCAGDTLVTLTNPSPLDPDDVEARELYHLTFTDMPTGKTETVVILGESDALYAIAAWIAADDGLSFPTVLKMYQVLKEKVPKQLP